jgi:hypothetical protein
MSAKLARRDHRAAWLFLLPVVAVILLVAVWPLSRTFFFSFTDAYLDDPSVYSMVGFDNFIEVINDHSWWVAVKNTLVFTVISVAIETTLGLAIALLLNEMIPGRGLARAAILVPWAIPVVVATKIWEWMLNDQFGVINKILSGLGRRRSRDRLDGQQLADHGRSDLHRCVDDDTLHGAFDPRRPAADLAGDLRSSRGGRHSGVEALLVDHPADAAAGHRRRRSLPCSTRSGCST